MALGLSNAFILRCYRLNGQHSMSSCLLFEKMNSDHTTYVPLSVIFKAH